MGLFRRVNDIISANLNDLVDRFEDPEKMLKQAIREMEVLIEETTAAAAKAIASEKLLTKELSEHTQQMRYWQDQAERSVRSNDDALARQSLRRKGEHAKLARALEDQLESASRTGQTLRRQIGAMRAKHAEAKRKLATLAARHRAAQARQRMNSVASAASRPTNAFAQFDRMCERVEQAEAEADAFAELVSGSDPTQSLDAAADLDNQAIESELAALKAQTGRE
jgi:phage shock protein A